MPDKIDTFFQKHIICPYCGYENRDAWEIDFGSGLDGEAEIYCRSCDNLMRISREVSVYYSTYKTEK